MKTFLNILPPERKEDLRLMKWYRKLIHQEVGILFLVFFLIGLISGVWFLLTLEEKAILERNTEKARGNAIYADVVSYEELFVEIQKKIPFVERLVGEQKNILWLFHFIEGNMSEGIVLSSVSVDEATLKISGHAGTRDQLLVFQEKFQKEECFSDVSLPLSQLAKREGIDFEITALVRGKCF